MLRLLGKQTVRLLQMRKDRDRLEIEKLSAERANAAKRDFIAAISHDIRNPLNSLLGMSEMIKEQPISESIHSYVDHIQNAGEVILNLVNDTIELARLEENASILHNEWFNLSECLAVYHSFFKQETKRKKIEFQLTNEISETVFLLSDKRKLEKIIWNLTANAVKFTHHGGVYCHVSLETKADDHAILMIQIRDTGPGISPEIKDRLFLKYNEFVPEGCEISGSGLGLSIVKLSLEEMNGSIQVESQVGEGSSFLVKIPIVWKREERISTQSKDPSKKDLDFPPFLNRKKVLIADDNELNRKVLKNYLRPLPFDITETSNGLETERILAQEAFDIAFLDIEMPGKHGTEIAKSLTTENTRPILFACTGLCMPEEKQHILNSGFEYFMPKPYLKEELFTHLAEIAKKHP